MLQIDFSNLFKVSGDHGLAEKELDRVFIRLPACLEQFKNRAQDFFRVIDDTAAVAEIKQFVRERRERYRDVVVLGIGGSALGASCLQQSLTPLYGHKARRPGPGLYILDNIDPVMMREILDVINLKRTLFIVVTKSGGTPETLAQYFYFQALVAKAGGRVGQQFVVVTDPQEGFLRRAAERDGIPTFPVPPRVGGRFSVLTAVGLLPGAFMGVNIDKLLRGARVMRDRFLSPDPRINDSFRLAAVQHLLAQKGKSINVLMPYAQKLIRFADWYRQLLSESIGKAVDERGETVHAGLTPVSALGVTDQHSQSQLYNEGPNDKLIMFLNVKNLGPRVNIPSPPSGESTLAFLRRTSFNELMDVECQGTQRSYTENDRPNLAITVDRLDEDHLGQLFILFQGATAFLGELTGVDAFNQPGVERAKQVTKEILLARQGAKKRT
ncbi:MAG: Glucose-6-phosphate isomerase [Candidatus Magasanikbacteria bacterium GW2011_GWA2_56_11]|uniref:Glucose-6-phosphate isomerase n=1 Tax=Candidatus Magasanikbacteria bacterium GW2011_GWA2_56_11 TaxID=1619044 RepID=A0A0G1YH94_9BACT|nr:MAG: Glucose-6-phosphate isomerase [Candidatus Magasanikbacteria bacterium GW2011_GWA2_56_11]